MTSCDLFDKGNPIITLVESYPCQSKEELLKRERYYIENNDCVNKQIPGQQRQEYYEKHRDKILNEKKQYYEKNKEIISLRGQNYYYHNKDEELARNKDYRDANKEVIQAKKKETYLCKCGMTLAKWSKSNHEKTKFHKETIEGTA
jgi:CDGSH-type Zn-finger protein